jgi:hypothetical protein
MAPNPSKKPGPHESPEMAGPGSKSGVIYIQRDYSAFTIGPYYDVVGTHLNFGRTSSMAILCTKFYTPPKTRYLTYVI